tara:strand:- start:61994 stop:62452 length:459 start_codon:yes stop_codon:yes gene_type:complete
MVQNFILVGQYDGENMSVSVLDFPNILLVEDDDIDRECVVRLFEKHKIIDRLLFAHDGCDAILKLSKYQAKNKERFPGLIMLDINMPKINGFDFLKYCRENDNLRHIPIVILTTSDRKKDIEQAKQFAVLDYIVKPLEEKHLSLASDSKIMQ